ncbi:hypothetical protein OOK31_24985 [Streptomyces sp. NBC_00249]|uniref:hypothetical protein n=1 Tax=Streptomyces sp. NBC_00249 TaxID=2975690 RepID=UPI0022500BF4|nr:hypothetical protein [Streptomyces sp. NBC_00249]MCX5197111.1 hypothetical protein [Streptomyces sp. NBC_00249]
MPEDLGPGWRGQEALTNVRKHAPRTPNRVRVLGRPGEGLTVEKPPTGRRYPHSRPGTAPTWC